MNIKHKAALITIAGFFGIIAFFYTMMYYPLVIVFAGLGGLVFLAYKAVLNHLEYNEKRKPR